jgi:hypothetical protein
MAARYGIPLERITVVSNYPVFDHGAAAPAPAAVDGPVRLVFSGGFNLENNRLDLLLGALRHVPGVDLSLMAFGYGDGEAVLRRLIAGYGLAERVRFLPLVKPHEVMGAIRGFDAAVNLLINPRDDIAIRFPSVNKMYEYLAAGLPILCSDIEGFQEEFVREGVAVAVNALDEASIADGLRSLAGNRTRLPKMKERAVSFVTEAFDTHVCRMAVIEDPDGNDVDAHRQNDPGGARGERMHQAGVAEDVHHARDPTGHLGHHVERGLREETRIGGTCAVEPGRDIRRDLRRRQRPDADAQRDPLAQLPERRIREARIQLGLTGKHDLQYLLAPGLQVRQQPQLLEPLAAEVLRVARPSMADRVAVEEDDDGWRGRTFEIPCTTETDGSLFSPFASTPTRSSAFCTLRRLPLP